jgi:hypothetical protein
MNLLLILVGAALLYLSYRGIIDMPWWVGVVVAASPLVLNLFGSIFQSARLDSTAGDGIDACGCTGAPVSYYYKPFGFWSKKRYGSAPCSTFNELVASKPNRYFQTGCGL